MLGLKSKKEETATGNGLAGRIRDQILNRTITNGHKKSDVARIDEKIRETIASYSTKPEEEIGERLEKLEKEWNAEKTARTNAIMLSLLGLGMGLFSNRRWFLLSGLALPLFFTKKPLKMVGIRSQKEIEAEKYALRSLRGDFAR